MPSSSWPPIPRSCSAEYQPGSGADIELCVAASTTSSSRRSHSAASPLHAATRLRGRLGAAAGGEGSDPGRDQHRRHHRHREAAAAPGPRGRSRPGR